MLDEDGRAHEFADLLRHARQAAGLTQEQLAERAGLSARGISDLERGTRRFPRRETVQQLADALVLGEDERQIWFRARRASAPQTDQQGSSEHPFTMLVGRETEQGVLRGGLEQSLLQRGQVILLAGEPGIGKTRLAEDFSTYAESRGFSACWGRCHHDGGAPAYWPWIQALRALLDRLDPASVASLIDDRTVELFLLLPELRAGRPVGSPSDPDGDASRFQLMDSVTAFLQRIVSIQPLLLVLDDLQWSDRSSLLLLQFLAREMPAGRLLVLGLYRDTDIEPDHPLASTVLEVLRQPAGQHLSLRGLELDDVTIMVDHIAADNLPGNLVARVAERAAGNPFFIGEIIRHIESGASTTATSDAGWKFDVPAGVRELIRQRLKRLSEACLDVLRTASVIGREFDLRLLRDVCRSGAMEILDLVAEAEQARLVSAPSGVEMRSRFVHDLIRETIYDDLRPSQRILLHEQIGLALEGHSETGATPNFGRLAHHFSLAVPSAGHERAVRYLQMAGEQAMSQVAYENAVQHFSGAVDLLDNFGELDGEQGADILLNLGNARMRAGNIPAARETFRQAARIARRKRLPEHFARAAIGFSGGIVLLGRDDAEACELLDEACVILGPQASSLLAQCLARLALKLVSDIEPGTAPRRAMISVMAIDLARGVNDLEAEALALHSQHRDIWFGEPGDPEPGIAAGQKMVEVAKASGNAELIFTGLCWRMFEPLALGDLATVNELMGECEQLAFTLRQPFYTYMITSLRAMHHLIGGRLSEVEQLKDRALAIADDIGVPSGYTTFWWWLLTFQVLRERDRLDEVKASLVGLFDEQSGTRLGRAIVNAQLALVHASEVAEGHASSDTSHFTEVSSELDALITEIVDSADYSPKSHALYALVHLADAAVVAGDAAAARRLYEILQPKSTYVATAGGSFMTVGSIAHYCGLLSMTLEKWEDAERHFEDALATNERLEARLFAARTRYSWADMLLRRQHHGARERARLLLNEVEQAAADMGMTAMARQANELISRNFGT